MILRAVRAPSFTENGIPRPNRKKRIFPVGTFSRDAGTDFSGRRDAFLICRKRIFWLSERFPDMQDMHNYSSEYFPAYQEMYNYSSGRFPAYQEMNIFPSGRFPDMQEMNNFSSK
jgi:hypothetical protein